MRSCGEFLAKCRKVKGLSQTQVAGILGYESGQFISNWERNRSQPPIPVLKRLADLYGIPHETIFNFILERQVSKIFEQTSARRLAMEDLDRSIASGLQQQ
ncbi:helix-turn-helix domain-containing protein [Bdellovibrio sp. HCB290]|uniref:helix-turn-helix domain-containing protein n=1 Tax=Bdellovibrio sp. HCB290 TaxID=3394356 RepID=UPI0039B5FD84